MAFPRPSYSSLVLVLTAITIFLSDTSAFDVVPNLRPTSTKTSLHLFGGLKGAFANDDSLGKRDDAGIKGGAKFNNQVTINRNPIKAVPGQKVSQVAAAARVKITYSCKKGDCGTCEVMMNGRIIKACQATIPTGKCDIQTF